ncbi:reverse transcriptase [Gossypium australe]|uniref:Reverse transcriptase n=1 Tax=Gossypium australe TaxID=47621 RepID=A0A5B6WQ26_9ROSI|nr:reverse transcriptase [Gossypium australe]
MISSKILQFYKGLIGVANDNDDLIRPIIRDGIKETIFEENEKASSFNDYTTYFSKSFLNVRIQATPRISSLFFVVVLPKNVFLRTTQYVSDLISKSQNAFINRKTIIDNTLLAYDFLSNLFNGLLFVSLLLPYPDLLLVDSMGDLLFACLFVVTLNVLSKLLKVAIKHGVFKYHPKCLRLQLSHLSFANDLLVFVKSNVNSVVGIWCILKESYRFSSVQLNASKSELFVVGVSMEKLEIMKSITSFNIVKLLVRYLRVPVVSRKMSNSNYEPLIENILAKVNGWSTRHLTYVGRLQLIEVRLCFTRNKSLLAVDLLTQIKRWIGYEKYSRMEQGLYLVANLKHSWNKDGNAILLKID